MRIGYLTGMVPGRMHNGTEIATRTIADGLSACGHEVEFLGFHRRGDPLPPDVRRDRVDVRPIEFDTTGVAQKLGWTASALLRDEPLSITKYRGGGGAKILPRLFETYDMVLVDKAQLAWIFREPLNHVPHSVIWHAIEHVTYGQVAASRSGFGARVYRREALLLERIERRLVKTTPHVFALTEGDAAVLAGLGHDGPRHILPLTVPLSLVAPTQTDGPDVGLLGAWTWTANAVGLDWFFDAVLPALPADWRIEVGGHGSESVRADVAGPRRLGFVADAKAFLGSARVVAIPLQAGTGVSMKLVEAAAQGWPTVTTPIGVRGIDRLPPSVRVVETAEAFAAALVELRETPETVRARWRDLGRDWYHERMRDLATALSAGVEACLARPRRSTARRDGRE
ncbi:MAG: glycosyltransferase family 4 protein [Hyphomicrobiales bacterium]|nr:glycosyltransferase family 4 protein [Hyphomicrobiales bacterium]